MFDVQALFGLRQRYAFPNMPKLACLRQAFSYHCICHAAVVQRCFEQLLKLLACMTFRFMVGVLEQDTKWCPHACHFVWFAAPQRGRALLGATRRCGRCFEKRHALLRKMFGDQAQGELAHDFKAR